MGCKHVQGLGSHLTPVCLSLWHAYSHELLLLNTSDFGGAGVQAACANLTDSAKSIIDVCALRVWRIHGLGLHLERPGRCVSCRDMGDI